MAATERETSAGTRSSCPISTRQPVTAYARGLSGLFSLVLVAGSFFSITAVREADKTPHAGEENGVEVGDDGTFFFFLLFFGLCSWRPSRVFQSRRAVTRLLFRVLPLARRLCRGPSAQAHAHSLLQTRSRIPRRHDRSLGRFPSARAL